MACESRIGTGLVLVTFVLALASAVAAGRSSCPAPPRSPFSESALPADRRFVVEGDVVERIEAGSYVYLRVRDDDDASHWIVSLAATSAATHRVRAQVLGRAEDFESPRLARRFDTLLFAIVRAAEAVPNDRGVNP